MSKSDISIRWTGDVGCGDEIFPSFHLRQSKSEFDSGVCRLSRVCLDFASTDLFAILCSHVLKLRFYNLIPLFAWFELKIISAVGRIQGLMFLQA